MLFLTATWIDMIGSISATGPSVPTAMRPVAEPPAGTVSPSWPSGLRPNEFLLNRIWMLEIGAWPWFATITLPKRRKGGARHRCVST